jgi:NAD(P)H-dependent FMN reductase
MSNEHALTRRAILKGAAAGLAVSMIAPASALAASSQTLSNGEKAMKITVITGSPHKEGTSALLADEFIKGAIEAGHDVFRFNAAFETVSPCTGCDTCGMGNAECVLKDSMIGLYPHLLAADLIVFITPLYYFGFSAQIKTVIDRFYAVNSLLMGSGKKAMLLSTAWNNDDWTMQNLAAHYKTLVRYLRWSDSGMLLATGCGTREMIERTDFPDKAYKFGKSL